MPLDTSRLRSIKAFRGPSRTLFVFDASVGKWFVCAWDGTEALVPEEDMAGFLQHCLEALRRAAEEPRR